VALADLCKACRENLALTPRQVERLVEELEGDGLVEVFSLNGYVSVRLAKLEGGRP
jgi:hypothetical protein